MKLSFVGIMIKYRDYSKWSIVKQLELTNEFSKVTGYKVSMQESNFILYHSDKS